MAIPEEMMPEATKAAQYWTGVASWMAGRDIQVKPYTGQFQKSGSRVVPAFYRYDDDTIYMAKQFFDEGEWTPERLKNIGGDLGGAIRSFKKSMSEGEQEGDKPATPVEPPKVVHQDAQGRVIEGQATKEKDKT